jgi:hypothetical protein
VIDRLKDRAPSLKEVRQAEDIAALSQGVAPPSGTAYVLPYRELAIPNELGMGGFRQYVGVQLLVAFVLRRHDDAKGGAKATMFDTYKGEIELALAGWSIDPSNDLFELVSAKAAPMGNGATIYVQTWQTSRFLEASE